MTNFFSLLELLMGRRPVAAGLAMRAGWVGLLVVLLLPSQAANAQSEPAQQAAELAWQTRQQWASPDVAAADLRISSAHTEAPGLLYAYPQQSQAGIPVYNQVVTLVFKNGKLAHHAGSFLSTKAFAGQSAAPRVPAARAVATALATLPGHPEVRPAAQDGPTGPDQQQRFAPAGVARRPIVARLVWAKDKNQLPRLAWNVNVDVLASADWLNIRVDAATGQVLDQDNWTVNERAAHPAAATVHAAGAGTGPAHAPRAGALRQPSGAKSTLAATPASYTVVPFPGERPDVTPVATVASPWLLAGASNPIAAYGWHFDGTTNYTNTRGNNVAAYDDAANIDAPGNYAPATTAAPSLTFPYTPNPTAAPNTVANRNAAVTNLFYWSNLMHDVLYQYGFTEAASNFQADNQGRGGMGGDYVQAEAQDGGGLNNANFSTPPEGTSGRMQMYLWSPRAYYTLQVSAPAAIAGSYGAVEGTFSTNNMLSALGPISGQLVAYVDAGSSPATSLACGAHGGASLTNKIVLVYRGGCNFSAKVKNAQLAGALAVLVVNNVAGPATGMGGTDNTVTVPAVMVSQADGALLAAQLANGVQVTLPQPIAAAGPQLDGDFDSGIIAHEYGHGISSRLTGGGFNTACLSNAEQAGEGWSDFFALMMTTNWTTAQLTDGPRARTVGTYVSSQPTTAPGIRRYPYSTNLSVNPLTYADMTATPEVHAIGEIWTATLWDMAWNIIQVQGRIEPNLYASTSTGGNAVALQLVMQGLKLQPCQPGFLDSRDAILAADSLLYNGRYHCAIWGAFARRGMGFSAKEGASTSATDQTAAFDLPGVSLRKFTAPVAGNQFAINISAACECQTQAQVSITDQLPTGLQYVSSTGGTLSGSTVTFPNLSFAAGQQRTFQILARTAAGAGCAIALPVNDNREANTAGGLTPAVVTSGGGNAWAPSTVRAHSGTTTWACNDPKNISDVTLTSAAFTPGAFSLLSFYHYFSSERQYDGGLVAISVNNGAWQDAAPYFLLNGYNSVFATGTVSVGKPCFSGLSASANAIGPAAFQQSMVNLTAFSGQSIRVRFQFQSDLDNPGSINLPGWFIDDIQVQSGCGGTQQVQLLNSANAVTDSYAQPTFLIPPPPTITSLTPPSGPLGSTVTLTGQNLLGLTSVLVGEVPALFTVVSNTSVTLTVPRQATSQKVRVSNANGTALSATAFTVTRPSASSLFVGGAALTTNGSTTLDISDFSAPAVADVDGDGRLDLLVGDLYGNVRRFEQTTATGDQFAPVGTDNRLTTDGTTVLNAGFYVILAVTDLDGNGRLDLLAGNAAGNVVRYEQTAPNGGSFAGGAVLTTAGGTALNVGTYSDLAVTDLDGNGLLDLLVSNNAGNIQRYEQATANSSSFASIAPLTDAGNTPLALGNIGLTVTDLDSDGLLDILVGLNYGQVARYEQTAPAANSFTPLGNLTTNGTTAIAAGNYAKPAVTDVDGDGLLDLLVGDVNGTVRRFEQDVPGIITGIAPATGVAGTAGIVLTGTNLSGASAVLVNGAAATITGNTATTVTFTVPAGASNNQSITVTTANGPSLAYTGFAVRLLAAGSSPAANARTAPTANSALALTFTEPVTAASLAPSRTAGINVYSAQVGGRKAGSFVSSGSTVRYTSSLPGSRANFKPGETVSVSVPATVLGAGGLAARKRVYQFTTATGGPGRGNFQSGTSTSLDANPNAVATADVDGDGDLDLLTASQSGNGTVSVRLNGGDATGSNTGAFSNGATVAVGTDPRSMTLGDVDGDGDLDLLTANYNSNTVSVRLNGGDATGSNTGVFSNGADVGTGAQPAAVVLGDVDGDGDLDLLVANFNGNTVSVRLNGGDATGSNTGTFSNGSDANTGGYLACLAVGDVDGDGDLDLVTTDYFGGTLKVLLNGGDATGSNTGTFSKGSTATVGTAVYSLALGDVDGDGDLDVLAANSFSSSVGVRLNGGDASSSNTGTFSNGSDVPVNGSPYTVVLGDLDADGDLDFVSSNQLNGDVTVRLNGGDASGSNTGTFSNGSTVTVAGRQQGLTLGDVDGDGDLDLLAPILSGVTVSVRLNQVPAPLPVELTAFTAERRGSNVALAWATASEKNSARFEVERSLDGLTFVTIGTVAAAGNSSSAHHYELLDAQLPAGVALLYYRLKQVDRDGTFSYSPVRVVALSGAAAGLSLYPNPVYGGVATLTGAEASTTVTVYDALGRSIATATADATGTAALVLPAGLSAGVYVVRAGSKALRLTVE
jgi:hypothetical protein